jgi:hypothetical protein
MKLLTRDEYSQISEHLRYHIDNKLSITESVFRLGSDAYLDLVNETRSLYQEGKIYLSEDDQYIVEKLYTGQKAKWKNPKTGKEETVTLDDPKRMPPSMGDNLFMVFRPSQSDPEKAVLIGFGERSDKEGNNMIKKHEDPGNRAKFLARHNCKEKKDQYASGWWSCNVHLFWKQLGLSSNEPW